jgi:hypothetical protein
MITVNEVRNEPDHIGIVALFENGDLSLDQFF